MAIRVGISPQRFIHFLIGDNVGLLFRIDWLLGVDAKIQFGHEPLPPSGRGSGATIITPCLATVVQLAADSKYSKRPMHSQLTPWYFGCPNVQCSSAVWAFRSGIRVDGAQSERVPKPETTPGTAHRNDSCP